MSLTDEEIIEINLTRELYRAMPGAPAVPITATGPQYGAVEGNQHYAFCREIVSTIALLLRQRTSSPGQQELQRMVSITDELRKDR